jgi:hypothetical protein
MRHFEKWAEGKPEILVSFAQQCALSAASFCDFTRCFYEGGSHSNLLTFPSHREWQSYYKNHRITASFFLDFWAVIFPEKRPGFSQLIDSVRSMRKNDQELPEGITKLFGGVSDDLYWMSLAEVLPDSSSENVQSEMVNIVRSPKMNFFVNVYVICAAFYGEEPGILLRNARLGNYDALERLLRLDESMISEPGVAAQIFRLKASGKRSQYENLFACLGRKPKLDLTLQRIKHVKAGQISALAELMGVKLTAPDIRALFNAISKDSGKGLEDSDLPLNDEAFSKAVQRERAVWLKRFTRT